MPHCHRGPDPEETDLLTRLRHPLWSHGANGPPYLCPNETQADMNGAADKIERIQAALREIDDQCERAATEQLSPGEAICNIGVIVAGYVERGGRCLMPCRV